MALDLAAMTFALECVADERQRQHEKWGTQRHSWPEWMAVLGEEFGEACQEVCRVTWGGKMAIDLRRELVQIAAVCVAIVEHIDEVSDR